MPKKLLKFQNMLFRKKADVINLCNTMSEPEEKQTFEHLLEMAEKFAAKHE